MTAGTGATPEYIQELGKHNNIMKKGLDVGVKQKWNCMMS